MIFASFILGSVIVGYSVTDDLVIDNECDRIINQTIDNINLKDCIIAVDFDNTLAVTKYPKIIKPIDLTCKIIRKAKENGATIILWTCRENNELEAALNWCKENNIPIDYANENVPERISKYHNDSRKISADIYIDDKSINPRLRYN